MQGLIVINAEGGTVSSEERQFAHQVANTHKEMKFGTIRQVDALTGVEVEYHAYKKIAFTSGGINYFYSGAVELGCQCRTLNLVTEASELPVSIQYENVVETNPGCNSGGDNQTHEVVAYVGGVEVGRVSGGYVSTAGFGAIDSPCGGTPTRSATNIIAASADSGLTKPSPYALYNKNPSYSYNGFVYLLVSYNDSWSTPFDSAIEAAIAAYDAERSTTVYLSDGTILADIPRIGDTGNGTNLPHSQSWPGGNIINLQNYVDGELDSVATYEIDTPEDVCLPTYDDGGAGMATAIARFREFRLACSDVIIASLAAGILPDTLRPSIKTEHPLSTKISLPVSPITTLEDDADTTVNAATSSLVVTRSGTIQYTKPDETIESHAFSGTATVSVQTHSTDDTNVTSYIVTFVDFVVLVNDDDAAGGSLGIADFGSSFETVPYPSDVGGTFSILTEIDVSDSFNGTFIQDSSDVTLGFIINGSLTVLKDAGTVPSMVIGVDSSGSGFTPSVPAAADNRQIESIEIYETFRADYEPVYDEELEAGLRNWLDSGLADNEIITIYPIQYKSDSIGDMGLYPTDSDMEEADGIYLTKGYKFKYNYADGSFTFVGTKTIKDKRTGEVSERIDLPLLVAGSGEGSSGTIEDVLALAGLSSVEELYALFGASSEAEFLAAVGMSSMQEFIDFVLGGEVEPEDPRPNFIFKSTRSKTGWTDVDETYTDQQAALGDQFDEENLTLNGLYDFLN